MNSLLLLCGKSDTALGDAAIYAVVGFVIVTVVLAFLVGIFSLTGYIFNKTAKSGTARKKESVVTENLVEDLSSDDEVVAAITAAITVALEEETGEKPTFVIRRIVRKK